MALPGYGVYGAEEQEIEQRRRYADALRQQSMQPLETQMAGRAAIPISWTQGAAKLLQAYSGRKGIESADEDRKRVASERAQKTAALLSGIPQARQQITQQPFDMASVGQDMPGEAPIPGLQTEQTRMVQPTMQDRAAWLGQLAQVGPEAVSMGGTLMGMQAQQEGRAEDRAFRGQEAQLTREARAAESAATRSAREAQERRDQAFRDQQARQASIDRENNLRVAASLRPAPQGPQAQIIQTENGFMRVDPRTGAATPVVGPDNKPVQMKPTGKGVKTDTDKTLATYVAARDGLLTGLAGASTGPIAGRLPAVTEGAQVAEGGVSAMAPVLKQLFRVAGEGVFTDKDQELLMKMVPTRTDKPEARAKKIANIDSIISAKLGVEVPAYIPPEPELDASPSVSDRRVSGPRNPGRRVVVDY